MAWIALRRMLFHGTVYHRGERVPAERSANRLTLKATGYLTWSDDVVDDAEPVDETASSPDLRKMKRAELNAFAAEIGLDDPSSYPNMGALIDAIEAATTPAEVAPAETSDDDASETSGDADDDAADDPSDSGGPS